jgi:hypothetical protein
VRRASFFATLSESTLLWRGRDGGDVALVLEGGAVRERASVAVDPPGYRRSFAERRRRIDLAAYDRLSALTREMRRLVKEGRFLALHLGRGVRLDSRKLARLLPWI